MFDQIERVSLRVYRELVGTERDACKVVTGLSIIDVDKNSILAVPSGLGHEAVAKVTAELVGVPLQEIDTREC